MTTSSLLLNLNSNSCLNLLDLGSYFDLTCLLALKLAGLGINGSDLFLVDTPFYSTLDIGKLSLKLD
jgi:hypothetical protein